MTFWGNYFTKPVHQKKKKKRLSVGRQCATLSIYDACLPYKSEITSISTPQAVTQVTSEAIQAISIEAPMAYRQCSLNNYQVYISIWILFTLIHLLVIVFFRTPPNRFNFQIIKKKRILASKPKPSIAIQTFDKLSQNGSTQTDNDSTEHQFQSKVIALKALTAENPANPKNPKNPKNKISDDLESDRFRLFIKDKAKYIEGSPLGYALSFDHFF